MKINAKVSVIKSVKTGVSETTGREWRTQDIVISWYRTVRDGYDREQYLLVTLHGENIDKLAALNPVVGETTIDCDLDFQTKSFNGKVYNDVTLIL